MISLWARCCFHSSLIAQQLMTPKESFQRTKRDDLDWCTLHLFVLWGERRTHRCLLFMCPWANYLAPTMPCKGRIRQLWCLLKYWGDFSGKWVDGRPEFLMSAWYKHCWRASSLSRINMELCCASYSITRLSDRASSAFLQSTVFGKSGAWASGDVSGSLLVKHKRNKCTRSRCVRLQIRKSKCPLKYYLV